MLNDARDRRASLPALGVTPSPSGLLWKPDAVCASDPLSPFGKPAPLTGLEAQALVFVRSAWQDGEGFGVTCVHCSQRLQCSWSCRRHRLVHREALSREARSGHIEPPTGARVGPLGPGSNTGPLCTHGPTDLSPWAPLSAATCAVCPPSMAPEPVSTAPESPCIRE